MRRSPKASSSKRPPPTSRLVLIAFALTVLVHTPLDAVHAQDTSANERVWAYYGAVDYSSWDHLGDVTPLGRGGAFATTGTGISFGAYRSVARLGSANVLLGAELGFLGLNSNVIFADTDNFGGPESAFEVNRITSSLALRFGGSSARYFDVGIGLGTYFAQTKYIDCSVILRCFAAETSSDEIGLELSVRGAVGAGIIFGARVQLVDFDPIEAVDLGVRSLDGPIYSVYVGWEYGSWRRR